MTDFIFGITEDVVVYDIETYPNCFTATFKSVDKSKKWVFEISDRRNDSLLFAEFITVLQTHGVIGAGFNNIGFDYPVIHWMFKLASNGVPVQAESVYDKAMSIIKAPDNARFANMVWESDWLFPQLDLFKIHHFDNQAKSTSLKVLEFNMRMDSVEDLPFDVGTVLTNAEKDILLHYNEHDVDATIDFYHESVDLIRFRRELTDRYGRNFMNHNDTKIGKDYFIMELEKVDPQCCYRHIDGRRQIVQTKRDSIALGDVILPYIQFQQPEFNRILNWFKSQVITETKGSIKDVNCTINGFQFDFGTGGIHGSIDSQIVRSDDYWIIEDADVASYYPNLAITNNFHPAHLGDAFCTIYKEMYEQRKGYAKGTPENAMLKLALNGTYGDSNNQYSPFYDPQFTMSITVNGQLLLCLLTEKLIQLPELSVIQINTDGVTVKYPRQYQTWVHSVYRWWEELTKLQLETVEYSSMYIRDVNNYIAEYTNGKVKRKGAYEYLLGWHQNHSSLVVPKAAEAALVHGKDIRQFIESHDDVYDFMLRTKVPRSSQLEHGGVRVANTIRCYVSHEGAPLEKVMPAAGPLGEYKRAQKLTDQYFNAVMAEIGPGVWDERIHTKNKSVYEERRMGINTGWLVTLANDMSECAPVWNEFHSNVNHEWYIREAEKLVKPLLP